MIHMRNRACVPLVARSRDPGPTDLPILPNKTAETPSPFHDPYGGEGESTDGKRPLAEKAMAERLTQVLILDTDPDTLITLQQVLEQARVDTTITWDETEARLLLETRSFDLVVIGDHPPELDAAAILRDFRSLRIHVSLILRETVLPNDIEYFCGLGAIAVVPRRDPLAVLEQVTSLGHRRAPFKTTGVEAGFSHAH